MKRMIWLTTLFAVAALFTVAGCSGDDEQKVTAEQVKKEAKEAVDTAMTYSKQKKDEFMAQVNQQYDSLKQQSDELMQKAKEQAAAGKEQAKQVLADLQAKQKAVSDKMVAMKEAGGEAWTKAKPELEKAMKNLQEAYNKAKAELQ
ncbi:MAG: hypothetical protein K9K65_07020 [Desulfarculaceae bacterium]|nr:hypothetical protein [Desulfarculaceae bacterium]MCF8047623.1 hypothetical protein [Desulfarculaceae bacterium]MCF8065169.1 hypothetical protein [Desulfarculaceae bacterium]MCF8097578.1 hypothetical protein [Desulfarculaceae bacterium]MCF8123382.1 hypothetical protein [Desulfarculaceae bacterium]